MDTHPSHLESHEATDFAHDQVLSSPRDAFPLPTWAKVLACVSVILAFAGYAYLDFTADRPRPPFLLPSFVVSLLAIYLLAQSISRRYARQHLYHAHSRSLDDRFWLQGHALGRPGSFDVALWLTETGDRGPRVIVSAQKRIAVVSDALASEEVDLAPMLARVSLRSVIPWVSVVFLSMYPVAIIAGFIWGFPQRANNQVEQVMVLSVVYGILAAILLHRLGWIPILRRTILLSPGGVSYGGLWRTISFTRTDSVVLIEPSGKDELWHVHFLRADGRAAQIFTCPKPALNALLARWSYPALTSATAAQTPGPS